MLRRLSDDYKWLLDTCTVRFVGSEQCHQLVLSQGESIVGGWAIESVEFS